MESRKAEYDYCVGLLHAYLDDTSIINGVKNTIRDKIYISRRGVAEGFNFFSKTLATLGSSLDAGLRTGRFICPLGFKRYKQTALPSFLRGLLSKVFDNEGLILKELDLPSISELRQILYSFYKTERDFSEADIANAIKKFVDTDQRAGVYGPLEKSDSRILNLATEFLGTLFRELDPFDIIPSHGPGIVSSGERPHEKRIFSTKYKDIHDVYPYYRYFYVNSAHLLSCVADYRNRQVRKVGINRVLFVPKDSRGPRTIACEPLEYQYLQQGLRKVIYEHVETHPLTRGRVNFTDQSINQCLALSSSITEDYVTVDMKDASDRVSNELVKTLFKGTPLARPLQALRTPESLLPDGSIVELNKYAAMGSALCFPVEALVFYSLIHAVCVYHSIDVDAYVYGDDIICTKIVYDLISHHFPLYGLEINSKKSCVTGLFRESCGAEYYSGHDVTYIKARTLPFAESSKIASLVAQSNSLWDRAYYKAASFVASALKPLLRNIPHDQYGTDFLCYTHPRFPNRFALKGKRWNDKYHYWEFKAPCLQGVTYTSFPKGVVEEHGEYMRKVTNGWFPRFVAGSYAKRMVKIRKKFVAFK